VKSKTPHSLLELLDEFIAKHKSGRMLLKNGTRMRHGSISNYENLSKVLKDFCISTKFDLRIFSLSKASFGEMKKEKKYWKKFYFLFTKYLYSTKNCYDNYAGTLVKLIRSFFNYLEKEKGIITGNFHKSFYVRQEEIPIIVLNPQQLNFLIHDKAFENGLCTRLRKAKDIFVFGCTVGCRYSDLQSLTSFNIERIFEERYLKIVSKKTGAYSRLKLPSYANDILEKYKGKFKTLLPPLHLVNLIKYIREVAEIAGWTYPVKKFRQKQGRFIELKPENKKYGTHFRFCDLITTHTMRKTAITTFLSLGMPEQMVRKISGHSPGSKEFYRYVNFAQAYLDVESDKVFQKLERKENLLSQKY